jgi:tetratricopeptide (TPR) repeat protein
MTIASGFLIYATLFRLAVIGVGALAIYLGYRLFTIGLDEPAKLSTAEARAKMDALEVRFLVRNAAPGTVFALFGAVIIAVMLNQGSPELIIGDLRTATKAGELRPSSSIHLKGSAQARMDGIDFLQQLADERLTQGDSETALAVYARLLAMPDLTMAQAAPVLLGAANVYLQQKRPQEALPLARLVVGLDGASADGFVALARALEANGNWSEAVAAMEQAQTLDAGLTESLDALRSRRP